MDIDKYGPALHAMRCRFLHDGVKPSSHIQCEPTTPMLFKLLAGIGMEEMHHWSPTYQNMSLLDNACSWNDKFIAVAYQKTPKTLLYRSVSSVFE